jgi:flagellar hook-length control protein FliK
MTIETSSAHSSARASAVDPKHGKGKHVGSDAMALGGGGGFMEILASAEMAPTAETAVLEPASADAPPLVGALTAQPFVSSWTPTAGAADVLRKLSLVPMDDGSASLEDAVGFLKPDVGDLPGNGIPVESKKGDRSEPAVADDEPDVAPWLAQWTQHLQPSTDLSKNRLSVDANKGDTSAPAVADDGADVAPWLAQWTQHLQPPTDEPRAILAVSQEVNTRAASVAVEVPQVTAAVQKEIASLTMPVTLLDIGRRQLAAANLSPTPPIESSPVRSGGIAPLPAIPTPITNPTDGENLMVPSIKPGTTQAAHFQPSVVKQEAALLPLNALTIESGANGLAKPSKAQRSIAPGANVVEGAAAAQPAATGQLDKGALLPNVSRLDLAAMPSALVAAGLAEGTIGKRDEQNRDRSVFRSNGSEGILAGPPAFGAVGSTPAQFATELPMSTEMFVAEKVAYWISNDIQNAEMKLDGIGLEPVEVSIRMSGNEAHVAFRTDELQARSALENASANLKEMLQREGVVLSGVSVGTSGAGNSGDQERKSRQGSRQQSVVASVTQVRSEHAGTTTGRVSGSTLDLFV